MRLTKHTGETKDTKGCRFPYVCLQSKDVLTGEVVWKRYFDQIFGMDAATLQELKEKIGNK